MVHRISRNSGKPGLEGLQPGPSPKHTLELIWRILQLSLGPNTIACLIDSPSLTLDPCHCYPWEPDGAVITAASFLEEILHSRCFFTSLASYPLSFPEEAASPSPLLREDVGTKLSWKQKWLPVGAATGPDSRDTNPRTGLWPMTLLHGQSSDQWTW